VFSDQCHQGVLDGRAPARAAAPSLPDKWFLSWRAPTKATRVPLRRLSSVYPDGAPDGRRGAEVGAFPCLAGGGGGGTQSATDHR
jgi:hypothetical protein